MRKLLFMLIGIPILLMGAIDTVYFNRVDLFEPDIGFDSYVWSHSHQDSTLDTNQFGEVTVEWGDPIADSIVWSGATAGTLFIMTPFEVGKFNRFSLYIVNSGSPLDSFQIEYHPANILADYDHFPWDWRLDTAYAAYTDSLIHRAYFCEPFFKYVKWRFIDISSGVAHILRIYFSEKETG